MKIKNPLAFTIGIEFIFFAWCSFGHGDLKGFYG